METKDAVLRTLAYADVFDYPLSLSEIYRYLIAKKPFSEKEIQKSLSTYSFVVRQSSLYCFLDRKEIIALRKQREQESKRKLYKAKKIAQIITLLPTVLFVGVSGALAMENVTEDDDIDFFIITKIDTLWLTRLLISIFLTARGDPSLCLERAALPSSNPSIRPERSKRILSK